MKTIVIHIDEDRKVATLPTSLDFLLLMEVMDEYRFKIAGGVQKVEGMPAKFPDAKGDKGPQA